MPRSTRNCPHSQSLSPASSVLSRSNKARRMEAPQCTRGFFLPLEAALDADAEVVQAEKAGRVAGQCFGAKGPVVGEPVPAKQGILTRVVLGFLAADIRHSETAAV